jgi:hypothetical protein
VPLKLDRWHVVRISRTGLLAEVQVNDKKRVAQLANGAFTQVRQLDIPKRARKFKGGKNESLKKTQT